MVPARASVVASARLRKARTITTSPPATSVPPSAFAPAMWWVGAMNPNSEAIPAPPTINSTAVAINAARRRTPPRFRPVRMASAASAASAGMIGKTYRSCLVSENENTPTSSTTQIMRNRLMAGTPESASGLTTSAWRTRAHNAAAPVTRPAITKIDHGNRSPITTGT